MKIALFLIVGIALAFVAGALFERVAPRWMLRSAWKIWNPLFRGGAGIVPGWAVLETIGWRTGRRHQVPVGGRRQGTQFWVVAGHAAKSHYVRNIRADQRVRVRFHGRWRSARAHIVPGDDSVRRAFRLNPVNGLFLRMSTSDLATIRIELE